ncbi:MAG: MotA/TolQ/ExbB proton channel family protein [Myxococcota bacterium]|jgi:biopolymer transport protein ExbB/TolQ|nr:MotA/TolQ/ExbB proton channel family protein [Myxococcota bacterium]
MTTIFDIMARGGFVMWVLFALSLLSVLIAVDRLVLLFFRSRLDTGSFMSQVIALVESMSFGQAIEACNVRSKHPLTKVIRAGLAKSNRREKEIERAMEEELLSIVPGLHRGVGILGLLGNAATLLGLLGTIFGLIRAFEGVSAASAAARQQVLSEGISVAMYTTAYGLIVAIPILFAHQIITERLDKLLIQTEEGAAALLNALSARIADLGARK